MIELQQFVRDDIRGSLNMFWKRWGQSRDITFYTLLSISIPISHLEKKLSYTRFEIDLKYYGIISSYISKYYSILTSPTSKSFKLEVTSEWLDLNLAPARGRHDIFVDEKMGQQWELPTLHSYSVERAQRAIYTLHTNINVYLHSKKLNLSQSPYLLMSTKVKLNSISKSFFLSWKLDYDKNTLYICW